MCGARCFYCAEIILDDNPKGAVGARKEVNERVEEKTKQTIKKLISEKVFEW